MIRKFFNLATVEKVLKVVTTFVIIAAVYFAMEFVVAVDEDGGRHIVNTALCSDQTYYELNELECDGFGYWFILCGPFLALTLLAWILVFIAAERLKKPRDSETESHTNMP